MIGKEPRILIVEDDEEVVAVVRDTFESARIPLDTAGTLAAARECLSHGTYDGIVLDLGLPDGSGMSLAAELRKAGNNVPILMLTAQVAVGNRIEGLAQGADDYICKPFAPEELLARMRAVLRRAGNSGSVLSYGDLELDLLNRKVRYESEECSLSDREVELLAYLMKNAEKPLRRDELAHEVWGFDTDGDTGVVNVYVNYLRNKLERGDRGARLIHTIRGVGYMLSATEPR